MATAERGSNPFGWFLLGVVVGAAATVALYLYVTRPASHPDAQAAPSVRMETTPALPQPEIPVARRPAPSAPSPPAVRDTGRSPPTTDAQIADDAAAAGMTGKAPPAGGQADEQPTN